MLNFGNRFNICAFLDNHQYQLPGHEMECLAGFGCVKVADNLPDRLNDRGDTEDVHSLSARLSQPKRNLIWLRSLMTMSRYLAIFARA